MNIEYLSLLSYGALMTMIGFSVVFLFLLLLIMMITIVSKLLETPIFLINQTKTSENSDNTQRKHAIAIAVAMHYKNKGSSKS
ncbi:hypothetical protein PVA44_05550 [Entomospira nematocerorum]|uniref:Oxaloacetate decarboxylase gamma chain n=1 Tax=Entomospira nematocerorum TaxID=2719987 RepID=A0A968KSJ9_9SPIO|nr:hypothetical protein [Entomospira nematocera]NIZ46516.1 hypothetical protein [Entomospira nematocera]WDI33684.1 hypothetical protein PVA44_05550 [Entomospira nematocera]